MDFADVTLPGVTAIRESGRASVDRRCRRRVARPVHALFSCAGVADGTPGIERINFVGHRHLIDRMLARGMLGRGSAICFISSSAGLGWETNLAQLSELLDTPDFDAAARWFEEHGKVDYITTKQALCAYVARQAFALLKRGIRVNAICPGPTDTPLAQANRDLWLTFGDDYRAEVGIQPFTAMEQAYPLVFLCSDAAGAITGTTLLSDAGWMSSATTGSFPSATMIANLLLNRGGE
jgi:NAD(P)-dependent dehydrogenase (short-subunit alcohol dehydrogenase family)